MDRKNILQKIKKTLEEVLEINLVSVSEGDTLDKLGIDSIGLMTMVVYLESEYQCEIELNNDLVQNYNEAKIADIISSVEASISKE